MVFSVEFLIYLVAGITILTLYRSRRKTLEAFSPEYVPELGEKAFLELRSLLDTTYERTLYLGISFLFLAYATTRTGETKFFAVFLTIGLFIYNIPPRNKTMKFLASAGLNPGLLRQRGIRL